MMMNILLVFCMLGVTWTASAQEAEKEPNVPFILSLFGPVNSNPLPYRRTNSNVCLGVINCANRNVNGLTAAYGYNRVYNDMNGIGFGFAGNFVSNQGAGLEAGLGFNVNLGDLSGIQLALLNITGAHHRGLQAGFVNYTHKGFIGLQLSLLNIIREDIRGAQIGYVNYTHGEVKGLQLSFVNVGSDQISGVQAGFFNLSDEDVDGLQLGFLNISAGEDSESHTAVQIGILNISNQTKVVPIGIVNLIRGGRFDLEISRDRLGFNNLTLNTGSQYFYSIWSFDARDLNPDKKDLYYRERSNPLLSGFGLAYPFNAQNSVRIERLNIWPTNFDEDEFFVTRLLAEFSSSFYFRFHAGLERIEMMGESDQRFPIFQSHENRSYSLTAGLSINLLGWWTAEN